MVVRYTLGIVKVIGCHLFAGHFLQKSPTISGSFAKNNLQLKASYGSQPPVVILCTLWICTEHILMTLLMQTLQGGLES